MNDVAVGSLNYIPMEEGEGAVRLRSSTKQKIRGQTDHSEAYHNLGS